MEGTKLDLNLETLKKNRDALLLAEVGVWLHMLGKYHEKFLEDPYGNDKKAYDFKKFYNNLNNVLKDLLDKDWPLEILKVNELQELKNAPRSLSQFISKHDKREIKQGSAGILKILADSHGRGSGTEKGVLKKDGYSKQNKKVNLATAFGYESDLIDLNQLSVRKSQLYRFLEKELEFLKNNLSSNPSTFEWSNWRLKFIKQLENDFLTTCGDTRRPINDVTLWDQTAATVAFFKAELAEILLSGWRDPSDTNRNNQFKYRVLRVALDGMSYIGQSSRISDILARKEFIEKAFNNVKNLIEVECPLGFEIYRDINSILFLTCDINVLKCKDDQKTLKQLIKEKFDDVFNGEVDPDISLSKGSRNVFFIGNVIKKPIKPISPTISYLKKCWDKVEDKCSVCQLRPQGYGALGNREKAKDRKMCCICMDRLRGRSENWIKKHDKTIWIDEVADVNGHVALIAGKFDLRHWQNGEFISTFRNPKANCGTTFSKIMNELDVNPETKLEELSELNKIVKEEVIKNTLNINRLNDFLIKTEDLGNEQFSPISFNEKLTLAVWRKSPSFARLRRIWETTGNFWNSINEDLKDIVGTLETRLILSGNLTLNKCPENGYAYDFELKKGVKASFVCDGDRFISAFNLSYVVKQLQLDIPIGTSENGVAEKIKDFIEKQKSLDVYEDIIESKKENKVFSITQCEVTMEKHNYSPIIPILRDPEQFMVLVPTNKALEVVDKIKTEYEIQFSKVRNRLPLHMNMVFFNRKQPLYASLDAARRMLARESDYNALWEVKAIDEVDADMYPHSMGKLTNKCKKITLKRDNNKLNDECTFFVSYGLGDPNKEDIWYPYFFAEEKAMGTPEFNKRAYYFSAPFPSNKDDNNYEKKDLVYVKDLKMGDKVYFAPSTLDFEFLDVTSRRYELIYEDDERLPKVGEWATRPFLIDDLTIISEVWNDFSKLTLSQIYQFIEILDNWRQKWHITQSRDKIFEKFASYALKSAFGNKWPTLSDNSKMQLINMTLNGRIFDILELQLKILKNKPAREIELNLGVS